MRRTIILLMSIMALLVVAPAASAAYNITFTIGKTATPTEYRFFPSIQSDGFGDDEVECPALAMRFWTDEQASYANTNQGWDEQIKAKPFTLSKVGLRTVYAQVKDACGRESAIVPNTVWHGMAEPVPTKTVAPKLVSTIVTLPSKTDARTRLDFKTVSGPNTCASSAFRYANEDGNWKAGTVSRVRPFIAPSKGAGYKGVYVQLVATCDDGTHYSNVVYTRYTMPKVGTAAPKPATPILHSVSVPKTASGGTIAIKVKATDDRKITRIRFATEDGNWGVWGTYRPALGAPVSAGVGYKGLYVQVGDASGRTSSTSFHRFTRVA
ncbi:MAG: hypothetical protein JWO69_1665 [Thermoleophilia bacterium]|nr:hypothetical protein [Thermoleophilia bacterium]